MLETNCLRIIETRLCHEASDWLAIPQSGWLSPMLKGLIHIVFLFDKDVIPWNEILEMDPDLDTM